MKTNQIKCPKCSQTSFWKATDNRLKCKNCRYIFAPRPNPINIPNKILEEIISEFLLGHPTNIILQRINISKYKLLKLLTLLRILMTRDVLKSLRRIIKLDENYFNNQIKKIIKREKLEGLKLDSNIKIKNPVIGIVCKEGRVYAKVLPNIEVKDLKLFLKKQRKKEIFSFSEDWQKYIGLAFKGSLYRLIPSDGKKYKIDALDGFWGYLKRRLSTKGGIRRERLPFYLGEYAWRYNYRKLILKKQEKRLLNLVVSEFQ